MEIRNHVQLVGRLGADPRVRITVNGSKQARFTIAVTQTFSNRIGEQVTDVQWHSIVAWGALADVAIKILQKGTEVTVDGKLHNRSYRAKDGSRRLQTDVVANELFVLARRAA